MPLLHRAYTLWEELEAESGESLMDLCGLISAGPPDGEILPGVRLAAERYAVPVEEIDRSALRTRFPAFAIPEGFEALWEPTGGFLRVEACVRAYARLAEAHGATIESGVTTRRIEPSANGVRVETDRGVWTADRVIVSAGAWIPGFFPEIARAANLHVLRKVLGWYARQSIDSAVPDSTFFFEMPHGAYYGFPCLDGQTVKLAEHTGGDRVDDPLGVERSLRDGDATGPGRFIDEILPALTPAPVRHAVCLYTMTDDGHFLVGHHPEHTNVVLAGGFSGHGFKFMSAMGAVTAELATEGRSATPVDFLGFDRFSA